MLNVYALNTGVRHARPYFGHLQITPGTRCVRRSVALVYIRERTTGGTAALRFTRDGQFHRGPAERRRGVVPLDTVQHWRR